MPFTFVNSTRNRQESLFTDFLAFCHGKERELDRELSTNDMTLVRYVLNVASHIKAPVIDITDVPDGLRQALMVIDRYVATLSADRAETAPDDTLADILVATDMTRRAGYTVQPGGWLFLAPGAGAPKGFEPEATLFGWTIWRRPVRAADFDGRVHIVVPTFNRCALLKACLARVEAQSVADKINCIVVDDGSTDGVADMMAADYPHMTVLTGDGSLWWGGAVNKGIAHIRACMGNGDFFLFLNNDVMLDDTSIETLLLLALRDRATCWATAAVADTNAVASGERGHALYRFEWMLDLFSCHGQAIDVDYLFGRTSIMPVELLSNLPAIDTDAFRHYWADSDYSLRAKTFGYATCITGRTFVRLQHDRDTSGSHIDFFEKGRSVREIWRYFTDVKSLGCLKYAWRFHSRHNRRQRCAFIRAMIRKAIGNHKWLRRQPRPAKTR